MYIVYKITNTINGKFYIGYHRVKSGNPDDGYMGSGKLIKQAILKYGISNFVKEVLFVSESKNQALSKEIEEISKFLGSDLCYNIAAGGSGGDTWSNHPEYHRLVEEARVRSKYRATLPDYVNPAKRPEVAEKISLSNKGKPKAARTQEQNQAIQHKRFETFNQNKQDGLHKAVEESHIARSAAQKSRFANKPDTHGMLGNTHTPEARAKVAEARRRRGSVRDVIDPAKLAELDAASSARMKASNPMKDPSVKEKVRQQRIGKNTGADNPSAKTIYVIFDTVVLEFDTTRACVNYFPELNLSPTKISTLRNRHLMFHYKGLTFLS